MVNGRDALRVLQFVAKYQRMFLLRVSDLQDLTNAHLFNSVIRICLPLPCMTFRRSTMCD